MKYLLTALLMTVVLLLTAQETRNLADFNEVSAGTGIKVILEKSSETKARIEVENGDPADVVTEVRSNHLVVKFADSQGWTRFNRNRKATVTVFYKTLEAIKASSGARIYASNTIKANMLELDGSSGGIMELEVESESLTVDVSSGGILRIGGTTASMNVDVSSGGIFKGSDLRCETVDADASSGGVASFQVSESLSADASSGGSIRYQGNPEKIRSNASSAGSIRVAN